MKEEKARAIRLGIIVAVLFVGLFFVWKAPDFFSEKVTSAQEKSDKKTQVYFDQQGIEGTESSNASDYESKGGYAVFRNCEFVDAEVNSGGRFVVSFPNEATRLIQLYFVTADESAKSRVKELLSQQPFTVYTQFTNVGLEQAMYAFIEINEGAELAFLHEVLVNEKLAQISASGANLPNGKTAEQQRRALLEIHRDE